MSLLLRKRTITPLFKWPLGIEDAVLLLSAAYRTEVYARHRDFIDDRFTRDNIKHVAEALIKLNPKFCIVLCGDCGNGKSTMLAAIRTATAYLDDKGYFQYRSHNGDMRSVNAAFTFTNATDSTVATMEGIHRIAEMPVLAIDDLGQEPLEVQEFGNMVYPMMAVLEKRYEKCLPTFITTNLSPDQLGERYGKRVRDRLREMAFVVSFDNPSYRK